MSYPIRSNSQVIPAARLLSGDRVGNLAASPWPVLAVDRYLLTRSQVAARPTILAGGGMSSLGAAIGQFFSQIWRGIVRAFGGHSTQATSTTASNTVLPAAPGAPAGPLHLSLGPVPLEGYDGGKLVDFNHTTVKYLFGRVASHFDTSPIRSGAVSPEDFLRGMLPYMQAAGLQVTSIHHDTIQILLPQGEGGGYLTIDVLRDSGPNGANAWGWGAGDHPDAGPGPAPTPVVPGPTPLFVNQAAPGPAPGGAPGSAAGDLQTVPMQPEYQQVPVDTANNSSAILSAATWVRQNHPELFVDDRAKSYEAMTWVIGILRAHGYDATRCVNHPDLPIGNPVRVGSDSLVLADRVYDCFAAMGDPNASRPQAADVGPYGPSRARE